MRNSSPSLSSLLRILLLASGLAGGFAQADAQDSGPTNISDQTPDTNAPEQSQQPHELSDKVSEALPKVQPLVDAKDYNGALALIDSLLPGVGPTSYDRAILSTSKAQILFQKSDFAGALEPLETSLKLGETYHYFDKKTCQQFRFYLASLYNERASEDKDPAMQMVNYNKARGYIERWLQVVNDPDLPKAPSGIDVSNGEYLYAALLYNIAQRDPHNIDKALVQQALDAAGKGLRATAHPNDGFYVLELAAYQQLGNYADAADVLEHVLKTKPDNKTYWQQLTAFYLNLASMADEKQDEQQSRNYNIRAILTMERAQQHGALITPKDNLRLIIIYFNIGQYSQAAELLDAGIHNGNIEPTPDNWKLLSNAWQQLHKDMKAVEVLHEAAQLFPKVGQFDYLAAQILYGLNNTAEALKAIQSCVAKDGGDKPWQSWQFLAYLAFELQKFELAGDAVEHAAKYPQSRPKEIEGLRDAVQAAIEKRDAALQKAK
ncbi:MAG TPA: tetratricopeptide repeat protein [Opitutaceae bacterium]|jgi:tetratricopeptide (TPR) repeat protein|nr:tetratricopeptide repeat protein [Opitutaceae bacterium]